MPNTFTERTPRTGEIEALVSDLATCATGFDIFKCLRKIKDSHDFEWFSVAWNPDETRKYLKDRIILTNWSPELVEFLSDRNRLNNLVFVKEIWEAIIPLGLDFRARKGSDPENEIFDRYVEEGHHSMVIIPLRSRTGFNGYIAFSGKWDLPSTAGIMEIAYFCSFVHEAINRTIVNQQDMMAEMTNQQIDAIRMLAGGCSINRIAESLGMSPSGVNFHIQKAMSATGCKTRYALIAKCARAHIV